MQWLPDSLPPCKFYATIKASYVTAIGGGLFRDVFVNEHPIVFTKEIYAAASFLRVVTFYMFVVTRVSFEISVTATIVIVIAVRLLAVKNNWNLAGVTPQ